MGIAQKNNAQVYKHIGFTSTCDLFKSNRSRSFTVAIVQLVFLPIKSQHLWEIINNVHPYNYKIVSWGTPN